MPDTDTELDAAAQRYTDSLSYPCNAGAYVTSCIADGYRAGWAARESLLAKQSTGDVRDAKPEPSYWDYAERLAQSFEESQHSVT